jgi:hypothetical protein
MNKYIKRLIEWFNAKRRGDVRVAPHGARGRVYARAGTEPGIKTKTKLKPTLNPRRVYRAAEDAWYRRDPKTGELTKE